MTDQYHQQNINAPRGGRTVVATGAITLTPDDGFVSVDSSTALAPFEVIMPIAADMPGAIITLVALTGLAISIAPQAQLANGDFIVFPATATLPLATDNATAIIQSDGINTWYVLSSIA